MHDAGREAAWGVYNNIRCTTFRVSRVDLSLRFFNPVGSSNTFGSSLPLDLQTPPYTVVIGFPA